MHKILFDNIDQTFITELPSDAIRTNQVRQVTEAAFSFVKPKIPDSPSLVHANHELGLELGLNDEKMNSETFLKIMSGSFVHPNTEPYAMCYGGHQFGSWAGQLGDGRAINLFEVVEKEQRWALQLKGAGLTPYSRSADGLAVLRSSIREYLCSEAMYYLGVPTTRALSLVLTGDEVLRDMMYDGNAALEKGAIVCRVAPSFLRFGNFQIFAARRDTKNLKKLADYTIKYFHPDILNSARDKYIQLFRTITEQTLEMIIHWQRVGFVHGVMNTDNMSVLGLTIDYGPYGWMDNYDEDWTPNTTDRQSRRYRFGQQANVALWNLAQLANALFPLINQQEALIEILEWYKSTYATKYFQMMADKLGLESSSSTDQELISQLIDTFQLSETDMTIFFRNLSNYSKDANYSNFAELINPIQNAFYQPDEITGDLENKWVDWLGKYLNRIKQSTKSDLERRSFMDKVNPKYVLRNYMAQLAIDAADKGDYGLIQELFTVLQLPYSEQSKYEHWYAKRPEWARNRVGCSMLSCSS